MTPDWCHFNVRLARSRDHLRAKAASAPFEDEKFSYLVAFRGGPGPGGARILAPPRVVKTEAVFRLCDASGLSERSVSVRERGFKRLKKRAWGEVIGAEEIGDGRSDARPAQ
jgi:ribosomal protein RSM22 (predicted rRNA methylase)